MKTVAFVPVKGTSSRVPNKNTRIFNGEPFFLFTVRKLLRCKEIDEVYVDSEEDTILEMAAKAGAKPLKRDKALADNKTDGHKLFFNEVSQVDADVYIQHLCTSPFIKESTIREAITIVEKGEADSAILAKKDKLYVWQDEWPTYNVDKIPNSIDLPDTITEAMGLYVVEKHAAHTLQRRIGKKPKLVFGEPIELVDVNTEDDLKLAHTIAAGILAEEEKKLRLLGRFLSTPIVSDVLDDMGILSVLASGYMPNIAGAKMFGRARTLHLRKFKDGDNPDGIYDALKSYKEVVSNDIIVVQNDLPQFAYFGELNMSLAIRSGAIGAIISGVTRDSAGTSSSDFPVFAKGSYCRDIKGRGVVESINRPICIDGVMINPNDLILADQDGIVVIPRTHEEVVLKESIKKLGNEASILSDVCDDAEVEGLVDKFGFF
ncbi:MAG: cytidylyltransferase domain-containing protein [Opitutales bacterium]